MFLECSLRSREAWCVPVIELLQMSRPGKSLFVTIWCKSKMKWGQKWNIGSAQPHGKILWASLEHPLLNPPSPPLPCATAHLLLPPTCRDCGWPHGTLGGQHYPLPHSPGTLVMQLVVASWLLFSDYPQDVIQDWIGLASNPPLHMVKS